MNADNVQDTGLISGLPSSVGFKKPSLVLRFAADVVMLTAIVILGSKVIAVNRINQAVADIASRKIDEVTLRVGDYLPDVPMVAIGSEEEQISAWSAVRLPAVVYLFAPDCHYCEVERPELSKIAAAAQSQGYHFVAISTDWPIPTRKMFPNRVSFPILAEAGGNIMRAYRLNATPAFIVVSSMKRVDAIHVGLLSSESFATSLLGK